MRLIVVMGLLALFGCMTKTVTTEVEIKAQKEQKGRVDDRLAFNFRPILDTANLEVVQIGTLYLPTGKIVAGDPFFISDQKPFKVKVKPGRYPVDVLIHNVEEGHYRIAFSRIRFSEKPAERWTLALTEDITDEDIETLEEDAYFGYAVDAGLGCFTDSETNDIFNEAMTKYDRDNPGKNYYSDLLEEEFNAASEQHPRSGRPGDWNNHFPVKGDDRNVIMFSSGWGDGFYPTYWGYDFDGEIVELITDFIVVTGQE